MRQVTIDVRGIPRPQGSVRPYITPGGHAAVRNPDNVWRWRHQVQAAVAAAMAPTGPFQGPIELHLGFELPRPQSHFGTGVNAGTVKASAPSRPAAKKDDLDKLVRAVCDACTDGGAWEDDGQVVTLMAAKRYGTPGVRIVISELETQPDLYPGESYQEALL